MAVIDLCSSVTTSSSNSPGLSDLEVRDNLTGLKYLSSDFVQVLVCVGRLKPFKGCAENTVLLRNVM